MDWRGAESHTKVLIITCTHYTMVVVVLDKKEVAIKNIWGAEVPGSIFQKIVIILNYG